MSVNVFGGSSNGGDSGITMSEPDAKFLNKNGYISNITDNSIVGETNINNILNESIFRWSLTPQKTFTYHP